MFIWSIHPSTLRRRLERSVLSEEAFKEALQHLLIRLNPLNVSCVIFYGSRVKGFQRSLSDYDLLVATEKTPPNPLERIGLTSSITAESILKRGIWLSITLLSREEALEEANFPSPLMQTMLTGYRVLYDKDGFAGRLLEFVKERADLVYVERGRRWDLKRIV